ncbi:MAG: hypothetical protein Q4F97_10195 [Bacteroidales bacterium]|nr:hypothetical protein [Bacteroidales bacterium]
MPYRRLPNTDLARIRALETAIENEGIMENGKVVLSYKSVDDAKTFLPNFQRVHQLYLQSFETQVKSSKKYYLHLKNVRLYISHFIQVLNLAVVRNEVKKDAKKLYGLTPGDFGVPDLSSENSLLKWGESIINGEKERINNGGAPIYNPTIAKVSVHYNIFKESYYNQKVLQNNTSKNLAKISLMRDRADEIILELWNQAEETYKTLPTSLRIEKTQQLGVVYYCRPKEKKEIETNKLQKKIDF